MSNPAGFGAGAGYGGAATVAARVAGEVGERLVELRRTAPPGGPARLRDAADRAADELVHELLGSLAPGDAILSEESPDSSARLSAGRVWIVDPLDGTREFGVPGRTDWAVHVALWTAADGLVAGAVALPGLGLLLDSATVPRVGPRSPDTPLRIVVSRTRPPPAASSVAGALAGALAGAGGASFPVELIPRGSAGAKAAAVVTGEADVYLETGGLHEWDTAAPVAVARAAGLAVASPDGSAVRFNRPDPLQHGLVVCRPELLAVVVTALESARRAGPG